MYLLRARPEGITTDAGVSVIALEARDMHTDPCAFRFVSPPHVSALFRRGGEGGRVNPRQQSALFLCAATPERLNITALRRGVIRQTLESSAARQTTNPHSTLTTPRCSVALVSVLSSAPQGLEETIYRKGFGSIEHEPCRVRLALREALFPVAPMALQALMLRSCAIGLNLRQPGTEDQLYCRRRSAPQVH